jgi:hypothetical protein
MRSSAFSGLMGARKASSLPTARSGRTRIPPPGPNLRTGPSAAAFRFRQGRAAVIREGESIRQLYYASPYELSFLALLDERLCSVFFALAEASYIYIRAVCCSHLYSARYGWDVKKVARARAVPHG